MFHLEHFMMPRSTVRLALAFVLLSTGVAGQDQFAVEVAGQTIRIPQVDWKPMQNPEAFAVNFEATAKQTGEAFPQVITVFKLPMSARDRVGIEAGPAEFAEFFVVHPGKVTFQLRVDRGPYWILSRQTFDAPAAFAVDIREYKPFLSAEQNRLFLELFDAQVKRTRYQLQQLFSQRAVWPPA